MGRFAGSLRPGGPAAADDVWVAGTLSATEMALWGRMSGADRRHAVGVARRAQALAGGSASRPLAAAALLHDVGKIEAGLGVLGRVVATLAALTGLARRRIVTRRIDLYLDHAALGSRLLADAGSDPLVVSWAGEHHLSPGRWTVPLDLGHALKAADDD